MSKKSNEWQDDYIAMEKVLKDLYFLVRDSVESITLHFKDGEIGIVGTERVRELNVSSKSLQGDSNE